MPRLTRISLTDTLAFLADVPSAAIGKGVFLRRSAMEAVAERSGADLRAVRCMQALRRRYGEGPLFLRLPLRRQLVLLAPEHVRRVLADTPDPFCTASSEKVAALGHFEPRGSLLSSPEERPPRRRLSETVLESGCPVHSGYARFAAVIEREFAPMLAEALCRERLGWPDFSAAWLRMIRRIALGDAARDDQVLWSDLTKLRGDANWAFFKPRDRKRRARFLERIRSYLEAQAPGSLAATAASHAEPGAAPEDQIAQWLFASEPAGMATWRALALIKTQPVEAAHRAAPDLLRHAILESLRLWPTTPLILRQTVRAVDWPEDHIPRGTGVLVFSPFFHRDDERLPFAHSFAPDIWSDDAAAERHALVPFSAGSAICPARELVLLLGSLVLERLEREHAIAMCDPQRLPPGRLPGELDPFGLTYAVRQSSRIASAASASASISR